MCTNIKSLKTNKILKQHIGVNDYDNVALRKNSNYIKPKNYLVLRLLALTSIENNYFDVVHINDNKLNNDLSNLSLSPYSENVKNEQIKIIIIKKQFNQRYKNKK